MKSKKEQDTSRSRIEDGYTVELVDQHKRGLPDMYAIREGVEGHGNYVLDDDGVVLMFENILDWIEYVGNKKCLLRIPHPHRPEFGTSAVLHMFGQEELVLSKESENVVLNVITDAYKKMGYVKTAPAMREIIIYRTNHLSESLPNAPTGGSYDFETDTLSSVPSGWSRDFPSYDPTEYGVVYTTASCSSTGTLSAWSDVHPCVPDVDIKFNTPGGTIDPTVAAKFAWASKDQLEMWQKIISKEQQAQKLQPTAGPELIVPAKDDGSDSFFVGRTGDDELVVGKADEDIDAGDFVTVNVSPVVQKKKSLKKKLVDVLTKIKVSVDKWVDRGSS